MNRIDYANANRERYLDWCGEILHSPYTPLDKLEFAIISAHCNMGYAIEGWLATRGINHITPLAETLHANNVMAPGLKAGYIMHLRDMLDDGYPIPHECYQEFRRAHKYPGLGHCKLSFATALIDPIGSNVVCLDTHILQVYLNTRPTTAQVNRIYAHLPTYESIEGELIQEANEINLPPFAYQWATWDWKRARVDHLPPLDHSFMWRDGRTQFQLPMFSSLT